MILKKAMVPHSPRIVKENKKNHSSHLSHLQLVKKTKWMMNKRVKRKNLRMISK